MSRTTIGVDIGANSVKLAVCTPGQIRRVVTEPMPDQLVRDGRIVSADAMSAFLKETAVKHRVSGKNCAVVLPPSVAFTRRTVMPAMTVEQLKLNLPYEFRDYITQEKDKYFYDYALLEMENGEDGKPRQMELMAAAALKSTVRDYMDMFRRAGFRLKTAAPEEFAYANLIRLYEERHPQEGKREYCLIDLGHAATRVYIYTGRRFEVARVVDYGGAMLDGAIADAFHVDEHVAQAYKHANLNGELELEACRGVYRAIALDIMRAVNFYGYNTPGSSLNSAWLCGGGSRIAPLVEQLRQTLPLELRPITELLPESGGEDLDLGPAAIGIAQQ